MLSKKRYNFIIDLLYYACSITYVENDMLYSISYAYGLNNDYVILKLEQYLPLFFR